jgi:hypothetical protein
MFKEGIYSKYPLNNTVWIIDVEFSQTLST